MFKLYSNGLSRIMSICVNYTHVRYIRYVVRNERNLYILSCQADTDCQQKRYRQSKMKSCLLNFLFVDGFRFFLKYCVVLILFHVDVTFNIRYIYREYIHKWRQLHIIQADDSWSKSFCPPRPILPPLPKVQQISNELSGLHTLRCWQAAKLLKQHRVSSTSHLCTSKILFRKSPLRTAFIFDHWATRGCDRDIPATYKSRLFKSDVPCRQPSQNPQLVTLFIRFLDCARDFWSCSIDQLCQDWLFSIRFT